MPPSDARHAGQTRGSAMEVFRVFLALGLTSFGGPIAHIGYFHTTFVQRRAWLNDTQFAQLLAICQFLPGPASSQMGFAIGLFRAGWKGALAAFLAFTLPSALLMFGFASLAPHLGSERGAAALHGLKLVAVAVVAHALLGMMRKLTPDAPRMLIAAATTVLMLVWGAPWLQLIAIAAAGVLGALLCRHVSALPTASPPITYGGRAASLFAVVFVLGLVAAIALPAATTPNVATMAGAFYRAGALVFGGGHVVLPLLQQQVVDTGWVAPDTFLAGYGAAQAMPGPMFSLAAFLGAEVPLSLPSAAGAAIAVLAIFLPGFLLLLAALPAWSQLVKHQRAASVVAGINAGIVGLLLAAFYNPVWTTGIRSAADLVIAAIGFLLLSAARLSALWAVLWCVGAAVAWNLLR